MNTAVYGNSKAAQTLAKLVAEHPEAYKVGRKVGRLLAQFDRSVAGLKNFERREDAKFFYQLALRHYSEQASTLFGASKLATFAQNVMRTRYRQWLEA